MKPASELVTYYVEQLGMLLGVIIEAPRLVLYVQRLRDLGPQQIAYGFEQAGKYFKPEFGRTFPSPAELREWAEAWRPDEGSPMRRFNSVEDIDPERCPKDWTPREVFAAHLTQERVRDGGRRPLEYEDRGEFPSMRELGKNAGFTPEEVQAMLEFAKDKQRAHIADLEGNPEWRRMAEHLGGFPGLKRAVPTTVPADPIERKAWAHRKAVEMGWVAREPGSDDE